MWKMKRRSRLLLLIILVSLIVATGVEALGPPAGNVTPVGSIHQYALPGGQLSETNAAVYKTAHGIASNNTIRFDVSDLERLEPALGIKYNVTTTATFTIVYVGSRPTVVCPTCSLAIYSGGQETLVFPSGLSLALLIVSWNPVGPFMSEAKQVLFLDDFIHSNPLLSSSWTIDNYAASGTIPGEYTAAGFVAMVAQSSSSVETIHVNTPIAYSPSAYADGMIVKRKLTASLFPFQKVESNTANIKIGLAPLLSTGAFPGNAPYGTPNVDLNNDCAMSSNGADNIGVEFMVMDNGGRVFGVTCGDGGSNRFLLGTLDPTIYTVFTIETYGVYCSTCLDNVFTGTAWTWFRVYQNDKNGNVITSTDKNQNLTGNTAPLAGPHPIYIFASLQNANGAATHQTSYIDLVQLQNYGSPVCLFGCLPPIIEVGNLPPPLSSIWAGLVNLAAALGQGDIGFGSMILFGIFTLPVILTYAATRSTMLVASEFLAILGLLMASGLFGSIWVFGIVLSMGYLAFGIIKKMFLSGGMGGGGGGEGDG